MEKASGKQLKNVVIGVIASLIVVLLFCIVSIQMGNYGIVDIAAGSIYAFVLSVIISLSVVPMLASTLRKR